MKIGVTSLAFGKNLTLHETLKNSFPQAELEFAKKRLDQAHLKQMLESCDTLIVGLDPIDERVLSLQTRVKTIAKFGVGLDNIDFEATKKYGIEVVHTSGVNRRSVAEQALGFMLMLLRKLYVTSNRLKQGVWDKNGGVQLSGKTIGIIGVGYIGKELITLLKPFGCTILVNDVIDQQDYYEAQGVVEVSKEKLFQEADVITLHTPLESSTYHLINQQTLAMMKPTAFIINTARGNIIDLKALKKALQTEKIAGAAIDVYDQEPPQDYELIGLENLITTPHIGGNAKEAVEAMGLSAIDNLKKVYSK
jgi:D-3-phosphoglycerate dehydrogenase